MKQTLIVGDIHGCFNELQDLLDKAGLNEDDQIIAIGDLINRGPLSDRVVDFFIKTSQASSIMGNHEHKHLRAHRGEIQPALSILLSRWQMAENYATALEFIKHLPAYMELPDALLVHAFFEPHLLLQEQEERVLLGTMGAARHLNENYEHPWYTYYKGDKPIIVGHKDMSGKQQAFVYNDRVYGIDTGCVYGGKLTGILLPDFKIFSVSARLPYWQETLQHYIENE